jgi:hypothetical protein
MKCPMFDTNRGAPGEPTPPYSRDCLQAECAWWDAEAKVCVLVAIHYRLATISGSLMGIAKELTLREKR